MKSYTKEQLIKSMEKYYKEQNDAPYQFKKDVTDIKEDALETI